MWYVAATRRASNFSSSSKGDFALDFPPGVERIPHASVFSIDKLLARKLELDLPGGQIAEV
jgi:hypothetical protein